MGNEEMAEAEQEEGKEAPVKNAHNLLLDSVIEEDVINKHPCMMNLLRVVDFLNANFPEDFPCWMKPIETYMDSRTISLA